MRQSRRRGRRLEDVPQGVIEDVVEEAHTAGVVMTRAGVTRRPPRPRRPPPPPSRLRYLEGHPEISVRVCSDLKSELARQAQTKGVSLSHLVIERLMRSVDERASDLAEGYARGRKEGESAGYTRGYLDGADSAFPKGKAEGEVEGYRRGVAETEQLARAEGAIAGTVSALLASKSGRNIDVALARFGEQLKARPDLVARTREVAVQFGLSRELELFLRHGQFVDPRLAEMFERLERLRRSG